MAVVHVNKDNFEQEVLKNDKPVLVDFWATWCGPCMMLAPELEALAEAHPEITVAKVNVDENMELAMGFQISAIPALKVFRAGQVVKNAVGYQDKASLEDLLKNI